ncbi:hypothetical protein [Embleya sp. NPDC005575]|uniref:hypothetical protein n=1 Tax=Embleya sp. NPDC005575 TaxID=3156892 RepID=UPI0033BD4D38
MRVNTAGAVCVPYVVKALSAVPEKAGATSTAAGAPAVKRQADEAITSVPRRFEEGFANGSIRFHGSSVTNHGAPFLCPMTCATSAIRRRHGIAQPLVTQFV